MKIILIMILALSTSCMSGRGSDEIEMISKDVLKAKEGVEIKIIPLQKSGKKP